MNHELSKFGLFFDDLYNLKILDPAICKETYELKEECNDYTEKLDNFKQIIDELTSIAENLARNVEKEKTRAIASQNMLKAISNEREQQQQILKAEIVEKEIELERLKIEHQYLQRIETEQQEIINNLTQNQ